MCFARLILAASLVLLVAPRAFAAQNLAAKGAAVAVKYCGACHAIGPGGESPHPDAPPFHEIVGRLSLDNLEDIFGDAAASHAQMARVSLSHGQLKSLAGYIAAMK